MKLAHVFRLAVVSAILLGLAGPAFAQAPAPPAPPTVWEFFGIPQAAKKIRDGLINRKGKRPEWEAKPPLKALADPANLESPVPAIKAAAEIKAQEDLKAQKVKAIKYLAEVGCGCYPGVKEALLAALDDCTEEVRYQAAIAFCEASGNPCKLCNAGTCCDQESMKKLKDIATGQDENGCYKETSPRVRAAALNALHACERIVPPTEVPKELPTEALPKEVAPPSIQERGIEKKTPTPGTQASTSMRVDPVSLLGMAEVTDEPSLEALASCGPDDDTCGCDRCRRRRLGRRRPCVGVGPAPTPGEALAPVEPGGKLPTEAIPEERLYPAPTALAGTFGAPAGPESIVPNMIGDFFSGGMVFNGVINAGQPSFADTTVPIAGGDRRFKIVESNRPIPTDRFFVNYHHFHNSLRDVGGAPHSFNRCTFGVEKTFLDEVFSVELRVPFGTGLDSDQHLGQSVVATEFGNMALAAKALLWQNRRSACGFGLGMVFPTGDDGRLLDEYYGTEVVRVENEAVHLQPFIGCVWTPSNRLFMQAFAQVDFDANGNPVVISGNAPDRLFDQNLLFLDIGAGYWLYRNRSNRWITGIAPVAELHYTSTLQNTGLVFDPQYYGGSVTNPANRMDVLNLTAGFHFELGPSSTLTVAAVAPLREDAPRSLGEEHSLFDAEFTVQFNRRF